MTAPWLQGSFHSSHAASASSECEAASQPEAPAEAPKYVHTLKPSPKMPTDLGLPGFQVEPAFGWDRSDRVTE